jgi:uncharacterized OB-fold protein
MEVDPSAMEHMATLSHVAPGARLIVACPAVVARFGHAAIEDEPSSSRRMWGRTSMTNRPQPVPTEDTQHFWDAARRHQIVLQRCEECNALRHPPLPSCPSCRSLDWAEHPVSGRGTLVSYVVPRKPQLPFMEDGYVVALVELEEGPRLVTNLVDVAVEDIVIDMAVEACFEELDSGVVLPQFRPVGVGS